MENNPFNLNNKTVVITGGASGIGAASAELFASVGAKVFVSDINLDACRERHAKSDFAKQIIVGHCDVASKQSVDDYIAGVLAESEVDVLFNNAGAGMVGRIEQTSEEDFSAANKGAARCSRHQKEAGQGQLREGRPYYIH